MKKIFFFVLLLSLTGFVSAESLCMDCLYTFGGVIDTVWCEMDGSGSCLTSCGLCTGMGGSCITELTSCPDFPLSECINCTASGGGWYGGECYIPGPVYVPWIGSIVVDFCNYPGITCQYCYETTPSTLPDSVPVPEPSLPVLFVLSLLSLISVLTYFCVSRR